MDFSPTGITVILGGIGLLLPILGAQIVNIIMAAKAEKQAKQGLEQSKENAKEIAEVKIGTAVVLGHVNSEKTAAEGRETLLQKENAMLREMLTEMKQTAALLAQSSAQAIPTPTAPKVQDVHIVQTEPELVKQETAP